MYRYGKTGGYVPRRRRSHRLRNGAIAVLLLLAVAVLLVNTSVGASILRRVGVGQRIAAAPTPGASASAVVANGKGTPVPAQGSSGAPGQAATPAAGPVATGQPGAVSTAVVPSGPGAAPVGTAQPTAPAAPATSPVETARRYLQNWQAADYKGMYSLLSKDSRNKYKQDYFLTRYTRIYSGATVQSVQAALAPDAEQRAAQSQELLLELPISVTTKTSLVGDIKENNLLTLVKEDTVWRVQWTPAMIFKDLQGDNRVTVDVYPAARGGIYDRKGRPLAIEGQIMQVGVVPGQIQNEAQLLDRVSKSLGVSKDYVKSRYKSAPDPTWFMPIRDLPRDKAQRIQQELAGIPGVSFQERAGREYPQGTALAQTLGYVGPIFAEDLKKPEYKDYSPNDVIGRAGLEAWGEPYLRGTIGGKVSIVGQDGAAVKVVKERLAKPGNNIYLNIDLDLQVKSQQDLAGKQGAIVALNPSNGEILAMASEPSYDPNAFVIGISQQDWNKLNSKESGFPLLNRAAGSSYPMASTFKPITMAATLTAGLYKTDSSFFDPGYWNKLGENPPRGDWKAGGHGWITLLGGLIQSCDIVFYEQGLALYKKDFNYLSEFAKKWWLGKRLGVDGLAVEAAGQVPGPGVPVPGWGPGDNVNLAIGQGYLLASPLQVANVYATIANGGTLYRPHLINRIVAADGSNKVIKAYNKPEVLGRAPASAATIAVLQRGLKAVTNTQQGTAYSVFKDFPIPVAGKTGTGQQDRKEPYAWFAGYAPADQPELAVVAMAENAGEGSVIAAPIVRQVMEQYLKPPPAAKP